MKVDGSTTELKLTEKGIEASDAGYSLPNQPRTIAVVGK
jgi:hypothetical protein